MKFHLIYAITLSHFISWLKQYIHDGKLTETAINGKSNCIIRCSFSRAQTDLCIYRLPFACDATKLHSCLCTNKIYLVTPQRRMTSVVAGIFLARRKCNGLKYFVIIFLVLTTPRRQFRPLGHNVTSLPAPLRQSVTSHHSHTWQRSGDLWLCTCYQSEHNPTDKYCYSDRTALTEPRWLSMYRPALRCAEPTKCSPTCSRQDIFLFSKISKPTPWPTQPPV